MQETFGKYRLIERIGKGGMAEVFLATQIGDLAGFEKQVALKTMSENLSDHEDLVIMFLDEARIAAQLNHPNIVHVYDLGRVDDTLYIAMEYVEGKDLRRICEVGINEKNFLPIEYAVRIIADAAAGLHYAHGVTDSQGQPRNIVHRDVTPQNILVSVDGQVKVADFGVAKAEDRLGHTRVGQRKGKLSYMSPEQFEADKIDARSDVYALGILLYETTVQTRLFRGRSDFETMSMIANSRVTPPSQVRPDFPADLEAIILRALQKDLNARYQSAQELQTALEDWLHRQERRVGPAEIAAYMRELFPPESFPQPQLGAETSPAQTSAATQPAAPQPAAHQFAAQQPAAQQTAAQQPALSAPSSQDFAVEATTISSFAEVMAADDARTQIYEEDDERTRVYDESSADVVRSSAHGTLPAPDRQPVIRVPQSALTASNAASPVEAEALPTPTSNAASTLPAPNSPGSSGSSASPVSAVSPGASGAHRPAASAPAPKRTAPAAAPQTASAPAPSPSIQSASSQSASSEQPESAAWQVEEVDDLDQVSFSDRRTYIMVGIGLVLAIVALGFGAKSILDSKDKLDSGVSAAGQPIEEEDEDIAPPEGPELVEVLLETEPEGARVVVNGLAADQQTPGHFKLVKDQVNDVIFYHPEFPARRVELDGRADGSPDAVRLEPFETEPETAILEIQSDPPGGIVYIDGERIGGAPQLLKDVPVGFAHHVEVRKADHWSFAGYFDLRAGERNAFRVRLESEDSPSALDRVEVTYDILPQYSEIEVNGETRGFSRAAIREQRGELLTVRMRNKHYQPQTRRILTDGIGTFTMRSFLPKAEGVDGKIKLTGAPADSTVYINARSYQKLPVEVTLSEDDYSVVVETADGERFEGKVKVYADSNTTYRLSVEDDQLDITEVN